MKSAIKLLVLLSILCLIGAPPVTEKKTSEDDEAKENRNKHFEEMGIEYNRYLVQVVEALESDPEFRKKLENATSEDIQTGKIADELDFVAHNVRSKLDELKRIELERLRKLARQQYDLANDIDTAHLKVPMADPAHLDHSNPHTFEAADLKKLITKTTEDLAEADKQRRDDFKKYEMEKEYEKNQKLNELDEEKKKKYLEEIEEREQKHKKHDPLHHPGSKQQLEEVWEKQDHMENQEFDPKAFFFMHDLDGNGVWDEAEVKALFLKELDKMYEAGAPEDDMRERAEEMERMREHVFREADLNHDSLISYAEFLQQTKKPEFEKDQGWEGLDEKPVYTQDEYHEFERRRQEEIQRLIQEGKLQPPPMYHPPPPPGYHAPPPPHGYQQGNQVPYNQQQQQFQQQQVYQQQQHFQQQQQNNLQQQQQYQQQTPQHFQQQQYQPQYQQPAVNNQQPIQNNAPQNQQLPLSNSIPQQVQPVQNSIPQQPPISNKIPQQQGQPLSNGIPQQQQPPLANNIPQQQAQPISNNIPQQQPHPNNSPQNPPAMSNEIPKAAGGPPLPVQSNSIPQH